ncbi:hypothetical protein D3C71_1094770 [compost metagenome]
MAEELAGVVAEHAGQARRLRWSGNQGHGFAEAQDRIVRRFAEHFDPGTRSDATVSRATDLHSGLCAAVEDLAGHCEEVGLDGPGRANDAQEVGVVGAAFDRLADVRIADEGFDGAGFRVHFGVRTVDTLQERSDVTIERAAEVARCADADVAGDVDRPTARGGDVDRFHTVRVGDGVGPGNRHVHPQTNPREACLVAVDWVFGRECRFDPGHIGVHAIPTDIVDAGFGEEPEGFRWPVIREHDRQRVIEKPGFRIQYAHVGGRARCGG